MTDKPAFLPAGAHLISYNDLERMAVTADGQLLWDGRPVRTDRRLKLTFWPALATGIVALGTFAQGVAAIYQTGTGLGWWATVITGSPK